MKKYKIEIKPSASKSLQKIDKQFAPKINAAITALSENPRPYGHIKLSGEESYRVRVGDYRIIYKIYDTKILVLVIAIDHRKDVYS